MASSSSSLDMPLPLSFMTIKFLPAHSRIISISFDPASIEFSTNSFTTDAGLSMTSPAAILLIVLFESILIVISLL